MADGLAIAVFWLCLSAIVYTYLGYPLLLKLLSACRSSDSPVDPPLWPRLSLVIAAFNEEAVLEAKLENSLALDYPPERLEILVVSDASTDRTDSIAAGWAARGVRLLRVEGRQGKTQAQNEAVAACTGEIVVFSDANAMYDLDALKQLARHFARPEVGCVEGRRMDWSPEASAVAAHELSYRDYESWIKLLESRVATCTGATGPIYAVRRVSYIELPADAISDLMQPLLIRFRHGQRHLFEPGAVSREEVLPKMAREFPRKVRIITRCLHSLFAVPGLLNPLRAGSFALQIWSHRLLRWLVPVLALLLVAANLRLLDRPFHLAFFVLTLAFLALAGLGHLLDRFDLGPSLLRLPYYFVSANAAALVAWINWARGRTIRTWEPERR